MSKRGAPAMMSVDEIRRYARGIRDEEIVVDAQLLTMIEAEVAAYRTFLREPRPQLPPPEIADVLPLMGWLILEASLAPLLRVEAGYEGVGGERRRRSEAAAELIDRAADVARALPWPVFAPRALGAIRSQALVASKRDTESGYDDAWILHQEAGERHASYLDSHGSDPSRERYVRDLGEVLLQLALAETGTACRTAERVLSRWAEGRDEGIWDEQDSERWTQRLFRQLSEGAETGARALDVASGIARRWGFTDRVDEDRLALPTSHRLPAIMTARATVLMLSMSPEMENLGRQPGDGFDSWAEARNGLINRFEECYRHIERPAVGKDGRVWPMRPEHQRSLVQLRLHLALAVPGHDFPATLALPSCLAVNPLTDEAVEAMSRWLAETDERGTQRGDANVVGSTTKPSFIRSLNALRETYGAVGGYPQWRRSWFVLDRHCNESGRRQRVEQALRDAGATP
ncbi:MAG TPA: hypothetical protein VGD43_04485 [Micromonospora sp.]